VFRTEEACCDVDSVAIPQQGILKHRQCPVMYKGLKAGVPWNQNQVIELGVAPTLQGLIYKDIQECFYK
jgi:hypothetical protein